MQELFIQELASQASEQGKRKQVDYTHLAEYIQNTDHMDFIQGLKHTRAGWIILLLVNLDIRSFCYLV